MAEQDQKSTENYEAATRGGAADTLAEFDAHDTGLIGRLHGVLHRTPALVPLVVLIAAVIVFGMINPNFWRVSTLSLIFQQIGIVGILGIAQTLVILTAGIDLSVGAIMVLSSVVMGQFTFRYGLPAPVSILCGLGCGTLMGFINGWLVAKVKLPPFIVTLGMWQIVLASTYLFSRNEISIMSTL